MKLTLTENGPYLAEGDFRFLDAKRKLLETDGAYELCRCGASSTSPFCDRKRCDEGFGAAGDSAEPRWRRYTGTTIDVGYSARICIHDGACTFGAPDVFDPRKRPWVDPKDFDADKIAAVVHRCPSGALVYDRLDGGSQEPPDTPEVIQTTRNGPFYLRGDIEIVSPDGERIFRGTRASLCRCGASRNKPFCDENHEMVRFKDP